MNKFKVGDKVAGTQSDFKDMMGIIVKIESDSIPYLVEFANWREGHGVNRNRWRFNGEDLTLIEDETAEVEKRACFALQYDLDEDPTEYFADMKAVEARIQELSGRSDLKRDSIRVHEIARTWKVDLSTKVTMTEVKTDVPSPTDVLRKGWEAKTCSECGRYFKSKQGVAVHVARSHLSL